MQLIGASEKFRVVGGGGDGHGESMAAVRQRRVSFVGRIPRHHEENLVQRKDLRSAASDEPMAFMDGVEGPSQHADVHFSPTPS